MMSINKKEFIEFIKKKKKDKIGGDLYNISYEIIGQDYKIFYLEYTKCYIIIYK